jgi:putative transposase
MTSVLTSLLATVRGVVRSRAALHLEILALRHQLQVLQRSQPRRLRLRHVDRWLWAWLSHVWSGWRTTLVIVKPETVVGWHRKGFRLFWTWKSRRRTGRPRVSSEARALIRRLALENPLWGAPRIHGELLKLGVQVSQATVAKYITRPAATPPSQSWRTFLANHVAQIAAADFFVVPTATYRLLFVLVIVAHERRRVVHVAVTRHPTAAWTAQQLREAFPNAYVERFIGSIRRECLDHVIVLTAAGLRTMLNAYVTYYTNSRTHLSLDKDSPQSRPVCHLDDGRITAIPQVGGLHHRYERRAA